MAEPIHVWHYAGCGTCKKALAWLKASGRPYASTDLVLDGPPDAATLADIARRAGVPARKLFNTSGQVYRGEGWAERAVTMSDADVFAALAAQGRLVKRPLLLVGPRAAVGFDPVAWQALLGGP
jgi:arsenate reductase